MRSTELQINNSFSTERMSVTLKSLRLAGPEASAIFGLCM